MARLQGISGGLSGKMGSVVFRQRGGETIATQYQPQVKNPNTAGQQGSRAAFKLISQLAAVMAPGFGTLGVTKRGGHAKPSQRNGFSQLNYPLIETATEEGTVVAKIPMEQVQLTSSFRNLPELDVAQGDAGVIEVTFAGNLPADISTVRLVTVGYVNNVPAIVDLRDVPAATISTTAISIETGAGKFTVLAYGLIPSESAMATIDLDNIHTPDDEDFISAVDLNAMVAAGVLVETKTVGANITAV